MKTTIRQIAAGSMMTLLFMVGNVKATETENTSLKAIETSLQLESWMVMEVNWNTNFDLAAYDQETESNLELEDWMIRNNRWNMTANMMEELDASLELEPWMTHVEIWKGDNLENEPVLNLEKWMVDSNSWK